MITIVDEFTDVKPIAKHSGLAAASNETLVTPNFGPAWRCDPVTGQSNGYIARRHAGCILGENPLQDGSLCRINLAFAGLSGYVPIAVADSTHNVALTHTPDVVPSNLCGKVFQEGCSHDAPEADLHIVGDTLVKCMKFNARIFELLKNACQIFRVAGDSIKRFDNYDIELASFRFLHQLKKSVAIKQGSAGLGAIFEFPNDIDAFTGRICSADCKLIFDRAIILKVA